MGPLPPAPVTFARRRGARKFHRSRWRVSGGSLVEAEDGLGDADRLVAAVALDDGVDGELGAAGDVVERGQGGGGAHPGPGRYGGGEAHLAEPVVHLGVYRVDGEDLGPQWNEQGQGEVPVRDGAAERAADRALRVDVDPLVVTGGVGECVDAGLVDRHP